MTFPRSTYQINTDHGPVVLTTNSAKWVGSVGTDIAASALVVGNCPPRRLWVGVTGTLVLTVLVDPSTGTTATVTSKFVAGYPYDINNIIGVTASGSSATDLLFGW